MLLLFPQNMVKPSFKNTICKKNDIYDLDTKQFIFILIAIKESDYSLNHSI